LKVLSEFRMFYTVFKNEYSQIKNNVLLSIQEQCTPFLSVYENIGSVKHAYCFDTFTF